MPENLPKKRTCATTDVDERLMRTDPNYRNNRRAIELKTRAMIRTLRFGAREKTITIPVVVHVLYNTDEQNITDEQINSQIDVLNKDYRAQNDDIGKVPDVFKSFIADTNIEFKLADITRTHTDRTIFDPYDETEPMKFTSKGGQDAWSRDKYLNLWVCLLDGGVLGYAQFPGGPAETDGVVITYTAFGTTGTAAEPFNKGRTATHEIGHWLNLRHIWGDSPCGNDFVDDTPTQKEHNFECPTFPHITCNNGPNGDMFMNYMDYTNDACMQMFSQGQSMRIEAALLGPRASLLEAGVKDIVMVGDPAIVIAPDGRIDLFVKSSDNALWHKSQTTPNGAWSQWEDLSKDKRVLSKDIMGNPTVVRDQDGCMEIFVVTVDNSLWRLRQIELGGEWSQWEAIK
jgi:hypothetical protein